MNSFIKRHFLDAQKNLAAFIADDAHFEKISQASDKMVSAIKKGHKIISCGNGGSLCDAMHFAEELTGRFRNNRYPLPAISISDPAYISCVANDYGYENVFARFIQALGQKGDVLLAISTSGNSPNILKAAQAAKSTGMLVVALTGKSGGSLATLCDIEIRAPHSDFADHAQEIHIIIIHTLIGYIESMMNDE